MPREGHPACEGGPQSHGTGTSQLAGLPNGRPPNAFPAGKAFCIGGRDAMGRGFAPPYFPTTNLFEVVEGDGLAGDRPVWREASP